MATAQQLSVDDLILHDGQEIDFDSLLSSRQKFDLVLNTVGSFMHDSCRALCVDGGLVVTTVASPPASDKYGLIYCSLYSMWLRLKLIFRKVDFTPFQLCCHGKLLIALILVSGSHLWFYCYF